MDPAERAGVAGLEHAKPIVIGGWAERWCRACGAGGRRVDRPACQLLPPSTGDDCWIGGGAIVMPGAQAAARLGVGRLR